MYSRFQDQHVHVHVLLFHISSLIDDKMWRVFAMSKVLLLYSTYRRLLVSAANRTYCVGGNRDVENFIAGMANWNHCWHKLVQLIILVYRFLLSDSNTSLLNSFYYRDCRQNHPELCFENSGCFFLCKVLITRIQRAINFLASRHRTRRPSKTWQSSDRSP